MKTFTRVLIFLICSLITTAYAAGTNVISNKTNGTIKVKDDTTWADYILISPTVWGNLPKVSSGDIISFCWIDYPKSVSCMHNTIDMICRASSDNGKITVQGSTSGKMSATGDVSGCVSVK